MNDCHELDDCIDIQVACEKPLPIADEDVRKWVNLTLKEHSEVAELTLRFVDTHEIAELNKTYRKKDKPTNVLAFPSNLPDEIKIEYPLLGDIIICPNVLEKESQEQAIALDAHWAHIVIHGVLHLLGYDHIKEKDAQKMQTMEIKLLAKLGFANPYQQEDAISE
ncbi:metal-dependent hydrolase [Legionella beliardensis]|uniref:Endoribonuclease YbeY n=1 Tax=Legionella beliardensis TaxID=91822 RepID=A0A378I257_9GAMM|nr:rRNA maturation RNase YbeY [Legionella beliardensis]STX28781.1 metal-dependent hydrolase [Legionella beliardensis]